MSRQEAYRAAFKFFRTIAKLKLINRERLDLDLWRLIRNSLGENREWIDLLRGN